ncbi:hypothetical protein VTO42DRAFT_4712 [Malbranchea cinnamomea]
MAEEIPLPLYSSSGQQGDETPPPPYSPRPKPEMLLRDFLRILHDISLQLALRILRAGLFDIAQRLNPPYKRNVVTVAGHSAVVSIDADFMTAVQTTLVVFDSAHVDPQVSGVFQVFHSVLSGSIPSFNFGEGEEHPLHETEYFPATSTCNYMAAHKGHAESAQSFDRSVSSPRHELHAATFSPFHQDWKGALER